MSDSPQIQVSDKWDTYVKCGDSLESAALSLLTERVNDGFWYDDQAAKVAKNIVDRKDGEDAWRFLKNRRDYEYESVEKVITR